MGARRSGGEGAAACGYTSRITITLTCGWGRWSGGGVGLPSAHLEVMEADLVAAEGDRRIGRGRVDGVVTQHDPLSEAFGIREDPARDHIGIARRGKDADVAHVTFRVPCEQFGSIPFRPRPVTGSDGVQPPASPHPHHSPAGGRPFGPEVPVSSPSISSSIHLTPYTCHVTPACTRHVTPACTRHVTPACTRHVTPARPSRLQCVMCNRPATPWTHTTGGV